MRDGMVYRFERTAVQSTSTATLRPRRSTFSTSRPLVGLSCTNNPSRPDERALGHLDAIALGEVLVREHWHFGGDDLLHGLDLDVGNRREAGPSVFENAHDAACFQNLDVALLVHPVAHEQVPGEHGDANQPLLAAALRPDAHLRQKCRESFRRQLLRHGLLEVALRPHRIPRRILHSPSLPKLPRLRPLRFAISFFEIAGRCRVV